MLSSFFLQSLEKGLNRYLTLDPESAKRLRGLEGKTITMELEGLKLRFQLRILENKIQISEGDSLPADICIRGTPVSLITLALSRDKKNHFFNGNVTIEGNAELGQQIIDLFDQLEIDWEEHLSQLIGDFPAHQLGRFTRRFLSWGKEAGESLGQSVNEYIHEEKPWFPPEAALQEFYTGIDELRLDLDRLEARVKRLSDELQ